MTAIPFEILRDCHMTVNEIVIAKLEFRKKLSYPYLGQVCVLRSLSQGQGHMRKNDSFAYFNFLILCMWLQVINKVKVTHQGEGHIKVKVKISSSLPTLCKILLILTY